MSNYSERLKAGGGFKINKFKTNISEEFKEKEAKTKLKKVAKELSALQDKMYAHDKYSVLICIQGMDTAGKDSLIREVFKQFNVRGVDVQSFKVPNDKELQHDYLWRHYIALPEKGKFGIFNRSHYENVLVSRIHPEILLNERIPHINTTKDIPEDFWTQRYDQINNFEKHIAANGTIIFKFFLNLSKAEQKNRLIRRIDLPKHQWKFSPGDLEERNYWSQYMDSYEEMIRNTTKKHAPWYVIPADDKEVSRYLVGKILLEVLSEYKDIKYPELSEDIQMHIQKYKDQLNNE